jgi:large subunit ribosomal protein L9
MKLILTREVDGLGLAGDIVEVADGYGRNYLVPRGSAIVWSKGAEKQIVQLRRARDAREVRDLSHAQEIKSSLESLSVQLEARAGKDGRLFGSITTTDVANAVKSAGGPLLDRKRIQLPGHIKTTGRHAVRVRLHPDVTAAVNLEVVASAG